MRIFLEDVNYPKGSNLDHAALTRLDVIHKMQKFLALRNGEGVKLIIPKSFLII